MKLPKQIFTDEEPSAFLKNSSPPNSLTLNLMAQNSEYLQAPAVFFTLSAHPGKCQKSCGHTHCMNRCSDVYVDPDSWPVKADVRSNEEPSTGAWSIVSVL